MGDDTVVKDRGFVGDGDLVCRWHVDHYNDYDFGGEEDVATGKQIATGTFYLYDGESSIYLGEEGAENLLAMLTNFVAAYNQRKGEVEA